MSTEFDWGQLGKSWWIETAAKVGATEQQARFACRKHAGASNAGAARDSGYAQGVEARTHGYRLARVNKINSLLALAVEEAGAGYDGLMTVAERRQVLTALGRCSDPQVKIKAVDLLNKMDERDRADAIAAAKSQLEDPQVTLQEIASWSPELARLLAPKGGLKWPDGPTNLPHEEDAPDAA